MNELKVIEQRQVLGQDFRIYGDKENPLFLAKDVATWIEHNQPSRIAGLVDDEEKVMHNVHTLGGNQEMWFLTEDGLYEVLMQSRKAIAKAFKKEVKAILKQIRQTGGYIKVEHEDTPEEIMARAVLVAQKTIEQKNELLRIKDNNLKAQREIINEYKPKVEKYEEFLNADGLFKVTNIADMFGLTARKLNKILAELGIQYKQGTEWSLYARFKDKGYAQGVATTIYHNNGDAESKYTLKWTSRGIDFIASKLQSIGIYPVISNQVQQLSFN